MARTTDMTKLTRIGGAVLALSLLTSCSSATPTPDATSNPVPGATSTPADDQHGDVPTLGEPPVWDNAAKKDIRDKGLKALTLYSQRDWEALMPMLTDNAVRTYEAIPPSSVPDFSIVGDPELIDQTSVYLGVVMLETTLGNYKLTFQKLEADDEWLLETIEPPEGVR